MILQKEKDDILSGLKRMDFGKTVELNPKNSGYEKLVDTIKLIINWGLDKDNGFEITFNSDYTKFRKYHSVKSLKSNTVKK